jgi:hypothetical protein
MRRLRQRPAGCVERPREVIYRAYSGNTGLAAHARRLNLSGAGSRGLSPETQMRRRLVRMPASPILPARRRNCGSLHSSPETAARIDVPGTIVPITGFKYGR